MELLDGEVVFRDKVHKFTGDQMKTPVALLSLMMAIILMAILILAVSSSEPLICNQDCEAFLQNFHLLPGLAFRRNSRTRVLRAEYRAEDESKEEVVNSRKGVVAADDGRCSEIGASVLRQGGHAVDAAVATALCVGVVNPVSSGIGGGAFMVIFSASTSQARAYDMRETAPLAASQNMYQNNPAAKLSGPLSVAVPGELAGLYEAWRNYGRHPWRSLFEPAIKLARTGFVVLPYLASKIAENKDKIEADPGLRKIFAPKGDLLRAGDTCYNEELARTLVAVSERGPGVLYNGAVGEKLVADLTKAGGILTMADLRNYRVEVNDAMAVDVMDHTILGMPPPSSGTLGLSLVLNILENFGIRDLTNGSHDVLSLHRLIEAMKHMLAIRMNLGDPKFVNVTRFVDDMLSPSFATEIKKKISDYTTFSPEYYFTRWSQLRDHGTSHFCIVDQERNAVSMTTTVNSAFGSGILSPSTGVVFNNEMDDFSMPADSSPDSLPPSPANFVSPRKRPLSSMTPIVVLKNGELAGVIGGSGGMNIISAVIQVFLNRYVWGMKPLDAVLSSRVYHKLIPNVVKYENWTMIDGKHIELSGEDRAFLEGRGHKLEGTSGGAMCQLVVHDVNSGRPGVAMVRRKVKSVQPFRGILTAVSDPRKDGRPAAV